MSAKQLTDISTEELVNSLADTQEIVNKVPVKKTAKTLHTFIKFREAKGIKSGTNWVQGEMLFFIFNNWTIENNTYKIAYKNFISYCSTILKKKKVKNKYWFGLNREFIQKYLTQDVLDKATEYARTHNERKASKEKESSND